VADARRRWPGPTVVDLEFTLDRFDRLDSGQPGGLGGLGTRPGVLDEG